ncbi:hypothetical protein Rhopal_000673-T1 [Rhodotorula paludigena]|uniref:Uncharacterized protein n=1 Tax=Rhodotorula paludigena TaxID=86838 RepID=A0AAV5GCB2_9BASI|nr:hypothetical protein Rhopal_000673-T1 [Rhodotorula paludigena]
MSLPAKPSGAATGAAAGPSSGSASLSLLPPKPSGLPDRPPVSWGPGRGGRDDDDREEGEEPDLPPSRPPRRRGGRGRRGPPPDSRRGRSPSFDRDRDDRFYGRGPPPGGRYDPPTTAGQAAVEEPEPLEELPQREELESQQEQEPA